jgi:hypothetical protein
MRSAADPDAAIFGVPNQIGMISSLFVPAELVPVACGDT